MAPWICVVGIPGGCRRGIIGHSHVGGNGGRGELDCNFFLKSWVYLDCAGSKNAMLESEILL